MKLKNIGTCLAAVLTLATSCKKVIDKQPLDLRTEETVWSDPKSAQAYMNRIWYATIRTDYAYESWFGLYAGPFNTGEYVSDNSVTRAQRGTGGFKDETSVKDVTANIGAFDSFVDLRRVNLAIDHLNDPETRTKFTPSITDDMLGQAYFAKGLIYFARARNFGGYPIIDKTLTVTDELKLKRAGIQETYDYTISLLEKAATLLRKQPLSGRPNKSAAYALLSEVCIHGAAYIKYDMLNGGKSVDLTPYYNKSIAAVQSLTAEGLYSLEPQETYGKMFNDLSYASGSPKEIILAQLTPPNIFPVSNDKVIELNCFIPVFFNDLLTDAVKARYPGNTPFTGFVLNAGFQSIAPVPKVVDETFYIKDLDGKARRWPESQLFAKYITVIGTKYTLNAQANADGIKDVTELMYKNRDMRFYSTIAYDGSTYFNNKVDMRIGGNMHPRSYKVLSSAQGAITGYLYKKGIPETRSWLFGDITGWYKIGLRLSRAYLNAAEAYMMLGDNAKARELINLTRTTHGGLPALTSETGNDLWKIYMDERNAELILENDRYFTLLRSGIRNGAEGIPELNFGAVRELEIAADGKSYEFVNLPFDANVNNYNFNRHRYLLPVPKVITDQNPNYLPNNPRY
ncbi:RagB/SusD family nutrient uptake outer membrane protein [Mucilaginibacter terrae]|uniref:RagB/SusD family nutrient uptake outer membrane protein n=1 Tax=Mucilaginibacter terrae TaxID=1955052 RepID=A0ABU3GN53_9SPHI|nr:RagB/SusD family nutrient uptake outer membrane protein [Mucilaginibacter terrae]MDT3401199.1 hypothetical protein [Mucilaginibacter terrae]